MSTLDGEKLDLPVYYDIEDNSIANKHDKNIRTQMCVNSCSEIEKAGYWAGVYANKNWFDNYLNYDGLKLKHTLWITHYGIDSPSLDCDIWHYTSSGNVDGIKGNVDMNYRYRDLVEEVGVNPTSSNASGNNTQDNDVTYYRVNSGNRSVITPVAYNDTPV